MTPKCLGQADLGTGQRGIGLKTIFGKKKIRIYAMKFSETLIRFFMELTKKISQIFYRKYCGKQY